MVNDTTMVQAIATFMFIEERPLVFRWRHVRQAAGK